MKRLVKRIVIYASVMVALTLTLATEAAGSASLRSFSGRFQGGGLDTFTAGFNHGGPVRVRRGWIWRNLPVPCPGADTTSSAYFTFGMSVNNKRKFHGSTANRRFTATVHGRFSRRGHKAHGILRLRGTVHGRPNCDTGHVLWYAHHYH